MSNVIDLFTRDRITLGNPINFPDWQEPIYRLSLRLDKELSEVLQKPKFKIKDGVLHVSSYVGNIHKGCSTIPLPVNVDLIIDYIKKNDIKHLKLDDNCFMWMDRKYKITVRLLRRLKETNIKSITFKTYSDVFAHDEYLDLMKDLNIEIHASIFKVKREGAPSYKRRRKALDKFYSEIVKNKYLHLTEGEL